MPRPSAIRTERLRLEPLRADAIEAFLAGEVDLAEQLQGVRLPAELATERFFLDLQLGRMRGRPDGAEWCARLMIRTGDGVVVGHCGFHGPPDDPDVGRAEIGYTVLDPYRGQGYATEAARALVEWALDGRSPVVFASVSPGNAASLGVVSRLGFERTGSQVDEIDGEEWVFQLSRGRDQAGTEAP